MYSYHQLVQQATYTTGQIPKVLAVKFPHRRKDDRLGRHVEPDRKRFCRKQSLDQAFLEENFNDLFEDRQQAAVVDPDAALEERQDLRDLRQLSVVFG
jgi:hypothetical protein